MKRPTVIRTGFSMSQTIGQTWRTLRDRLAAADLPTPALDARLLVRHVLGLDETGLIASETDPFPPDKADPLAALFARRLEGEPVARIRGVQEFYGLDFGLNAATLIPRPETEMLVDFGIDALKDRSNPRILDLGTGTGCIVLSLLANIPGATGVGVDISPEAIGQARANAQALDLGERFETREGSWFAPLGGESFDLIVSNPPYIESAVIETLEPGVRRFDPPAALDGGPDGLAPYRVIARSAGDYLRPGGALALEIGYDQGHMVKALLQQAGFSSPLVARDLAGHDRMVTARAQK
ncbi:peptide chain release factor N(5)-glutamine methyltransferase [Pelagibacterium sp. H642]|uniref:peptide chain release factor N(5)-glutamine methyltransferase n=1 Tax=Pelagibacterium sp. H642 TaxID=1881069 RepID=UPI0028154E8D|nr:peptide chain release factor N(5)-glutamine methyltransferase [Pelagibacterium sp. H642]WMT89272.1 peptide chain release factor N(5)-glutamine methyltransferase [Pelagibacterium sp. H642]